MTLRRLNRVADIRRSSSCEVGKTWWAKAGLLRVAVVAVDASCGSLRPGRAAVRWPIWSAGERFTSSHARGNTRLIPAFVHPVLPDMPDKSPKYPHPPGPFRLTVPVSRFADYFLGKVRHVRQRFLKRFRSQSLTKISARHFAGRSSATPGIQLCFAALPRASVNALFRKLAAGQRALRVGARGERWCGKSQNCV